MPTTLLGPDGKPLVSPALSIGLREKFQRMMDSYVSRIRARWDAAQTFPGNEGHWSNTDGLDPHTAASHIVRQKLRFRSRYEIIENNPYLKGTILSICNDFVGRGPTLVITDPRISKARAIVIERLVSLYFKAIQLRQKIWRLRMAKLVDGESFMRVFLNKNRRIYNPVQLDFHVLEADRISSSPGILPKENIGEVDGVRFDSYEQPLEYHVLRHHPGGSPFTSYDLKKEGDWVKAKYIIHWFRQDRGWLRGIPELAPSLPLCALLRRYTLAVVRHAETAANLTAVIETEGPAGQTPYTDGNGNLIVDEPFDTFPIEQGMMCNLPYGYKLKQLEAIPFGVQYDAFTGALLREITRPILTPFNIAAGTSKDANMASGVLDANIYKSGQHAERLHCEEMVLEQIFSLWWMEASRITSFLGDEFLRSDNSFRDTPPQHRWRWDRVGVDHTDPSRVAEALETLHNKRFLTDADIQEGWFNRSIEDWRKEIAEDDEFRSNLLPMDSTGIIVPEPTPTNEDSDA